jgi:Holliday junction resolvase RusA-like endonuclease
MVMKRPQMNNEKQKWKDFIVWLINKNNLQDTKINKATIIFTYYFPTKHRHDADNYTPKNLMDGFTESGLLIDDDFEHIEMLCI